MKILQIVAITSTVLSSAAFAYPIDPVEDKETWWNPEKIVYPQPNQDPEKKYRRPPRPQQPSRIWDDVARLILGPGWRKWWNLEKTVYPRPNQKPDKTYRQPTSPQQPNREPDKTYRRPPRPQQPSRIWQGVASLSLGPGWGNAPNTTQTFFLQPDIEKSYVPQSNPSILGYGEVFAGVQTQVNHAFTLQLGVGLGGGTDTTLQGDIWEDADPDFNNYTYNYAVNETHVALKGKLLWDSHYKKIQPYVSAAFGVGFNASHGFSITPKLYQEVAPPLFENYTVIAFTYMFGIGLQKEINPHWHAGIGYEFADWGQSRLATAPGQTLNGGLSQSNLYINALQVNLTYIL